VTPTSFQGAEVRLRGLDGYGGGVDERDDQDGWSIRGGGGGERNEATPQH